MLKERVKLETYATIEERKQLSQMAKRLHLSRAEFIRRLILSFEIREFGKQEAVLSLLGVNADLARLGNLLKLALDNAEEDDLEINVSKINEIIVELDNAKNNLRQKIQEI